MNQLRGANMRLLRQLYDGIESRSVEPIAGTLASTVVLHVTSAGELDGTHTGRDAVLSFYERLVDELELGFRIPDFEVLVHDSSLVVAPAATSFGGGDAILGIDIYHFEDGLISEIWLTPWNTPTDRQA
jgi:hypothetical protein